MMKSLPPSLFPVTPKLFPGGTSCLFVFWLLLCQVYFRALCIRTERAAAFIFMVDGLQCILQCGYAMHYLTGLLLVSWMISSLL